MEFRIEIASTIRDKRRNQNMICDQGENSVSSFTWKNWGEGQEQEVFGEFIGWIPSLLVKMLATCTTSLKQRSGEETEKWQKGEVFGQKRAG